MNILLINGSPKGDRSNSLKLANAFLEGVCEEENIHSGIGQEQDQKKHIIQKIDVSRARIEGCRGCFACWKATPGKCCINDDMADIIQKQLWADLIVYSFPLYYFNVPGKLKNLIDRQLPMVLPFMSQREDGIGSGSHDARYDMSGKKYVLISTCGFYSAAGNYDSVRSMFDHLCGKNNYETVFCGQGELFSVKELAGRTENYLETVKKAGAEYARGGIRQETRGQLQELLFPKEIFEKMADASWGVSRESGEKEEDSLIFTRQMAALYDPQSFDGKERVLEMCYTDLGRTYQIVLTKTGSKVLTEGNLQYTTRIETPYEVWQKIAQNQLRGDEALMKQMYRVEGDFSLMMEWNRFFGGAAGEKQEPGKGIENEPDKKAAEKSSESRPPVMTTMLAAWITFWAAVSIDTGTGALVALAVSACLPFLMHRHELSFYDRISCGLTSVLAIAALTTGQGEMAVNAGYLLFGLLWLASCLTKEPLCACYVKYGYNGEDALKNPIFMRTNYILAAGWGILYVAIAVGSWLLADTPFAGSLMIVNNIMPILMGIFTGWFQKWYPAWIAGGGRKAGK